MVEFMLWDDGRRDTKLVRSNGIIAFMIVVEYNIQNTNTLTALHKTIHISRYIHNRNDNFITIEYSFVCTEFWWIMKVSHYYCSFLHTHIHLRPENVRYVVYFWNFC